MSSMEQHKSNETSDTSDSVPRLESSLKEGKHNMFETWFQLCFIFIFSLYFWWYVSVEIDENEKRRDFLSWDEYFMSAAFLTAMRSKVSNLNVT